MATFYTNDPTRNAGARTTHDPTVAQGGGQTFTYAGLINALSSVAASWKASWNPVELVAAGAGGITATVKLAWNPVELLASAASGISSAVKLTWNPTELAAAAQSGIAATWKVTASFQGGIPAGSAVPEAVNVTWNPVEILEAQSGVAAPMAVVYAPPAAISAQADVSATWSAVMTPAAVIAAVAGVDANVAFAPASAPSVLVVPAGISRPIIRRQRRRSRVFSYLGDIVSSHVGVASAVRFVRGRPQPRHVHHAGRICARRARPEARAHHRDYLRDVVRVQDERDLLALLGLPEDSGAFDLLDKRQGEVVRL